MAGHDNDGTMMMLPKVLMMMRKPVRRHSQASAQSRKRSCNGSQRCSRPLCRRCGCPEGEPEIIMMMRMILVMMMVIMIMMMYTVCEMCLPKDDDDKDHDDGDHDDDNVHVHRVGDVFA